MAPTNLGTNKWRIKVSVLDKTKGYPVGKQETFRGTRAEATIREAELLKELKTRCSFILPQASTFGEAVELYEKRLSLQGKLSPSHTKMIDFVCRKLGHLRIEGFADNFEAYRKSMVGSLTAHGKIRGNASINRYTQIVRAVFSYLVNHELIAKNPITQIRFPKLDEKPRDRNLTQDEISRLFSAIEKHRPHIMSIVQYMLLVPCRKMELVNAKREQYNPVTGTIYIPTSKNGRPIIKPVPEAMSVYFKSIPADCPYLFYQEIGGGKYRPLTNLRYAWAYCCRKAGIGDLRIHDLRHRAATWLHEMGNSIYTIMKIAGWRTNMLGIYWGQDGVTTAQQVKFPEVTSYDTDTVFSRAI